MTQSDEQTDFRDPSLLFAIELAVVANQLTREAAANLGRWLTEPHYAEYSPQLVALIRRADFAELNRLFWERLPFGTGGRRGPMSDFGSATINDRTIAESAHGLAVYVKRWCQQNNLLQPGLTPRAAVAFDSRHRSREFAQRTASVLAAHGFQVFFFPEPRATPELSFAVIAECCHTGVMISASHNPPSDNGFKAYWSTGGQVLSPHDAGIIECVDAAGEIPSVDFETAVRAGQIHLLGEIRDAAYVNAVCLQGLSPARDITALYTPLHGVGESSVFRVVRQLGFHGVSIFEPQRSLDGAFPNVPDQLPNPERFEVFGPAIAHAKQTGAELVLASDPDADRMAVAVRDHSGEFVCLTGNQLSSLLTDHVLSHRAAQRSLSADHFIIETLVTTPLVAAIGHHYGVKVVSDVLVGFKYIAHEIDRHGPDRFVFATEESIGFMAGNYCRDKDAAVGAIFVLELAAELKQRGETLLDQLDRLHARHGVHVEQTVSIMAPGATGHARLARIMQSLRDAPLPAFGPAVWESVRDYERHEIRSLPANIKSADLPAPTSNLLILNGRSQSIENEPTSACELTLAIRPSGTEPKIKCYGFARTSPAPDLAAAKRHTEQSLAAMLDSLQNWIAEVHGSTPFA